MESSQNTKNSAKAIVLEIVEARDLRALRSTKHAPNAFVKVTGGGLHLRTRVIERASYPQWQETHTIPRLPDKTVVTFSLFHRVNAMWKDSVGAADITFGELLQSEAPDIELILKGGRGKGNAGILVIRTREEDLAQLAAVAMDVSRIAAEQLSETLDKTETASSLMDLIPSMGVFLDIANQIATLHPYVQVAWQLTSLVVKIPRDQLLRDDEVVNLIGQMEELYSFVSASSKLKKLEILEDAVQAILNQTVECAFFIRGYTRLSFGERAIKHSVSGASEKIATMRDTFRRLRERFETASTIQISFVASRSLKILEDLKRDQNLTKLRPAAMPVAGRPSCLENTRLDVIKLITEWITDENQKPVFWLSGLSGTGKSTLSTSIADISRELQRLGAFIFFNRDIKERSDPAIMIRTLAHKLALFDGIIAEAVSAAIEGAPDIAESPLAFQFRKLVAEPLASVEEFHFGGPVVVVVDAFDECGNPASRKGLLQALSQGFSKLPSWIRILVTSRRERDLEGIFSAHPCVRSYELDPSSDSTAKDIEIFIQSELDDVRAENEGLGLPADWPGRDKIQALTARAAGLFVWASTACLFISDGHDPREQIDQILNTSESNASAPLEGLDRLYKTALLSAGKWDDAIFRSDCRAIIGLILVAKVPLKCTAIDDLLSLPRPSLHTIKGFGSVLLWSDKDPIRILHPSFQDFLTHQDRCGNDQWFIDVTLHHRNLAVACIDMLERTLKKNICNLTLGGPFDDQALPEGVTYACLYWIDHVCAGVDIDAERVYNFLAGHLLHWMEAMSIMRMSRKVISELRDLDQWVASKSHSQLSRLVYEAQRFARYFANACEEHPLLIYTTALSFTPVDSCIFKLFCNDRTLDVTGSVRTQGWSPRLLQIQGHSKLVQTVALSPDGSKIASGSMDKTVRVWDTHTGTELLPPLEGHSRVVRSVAFSPDGSKIVSGSWDSTIRVWDAAAGTELFPPLEDHTEAVLSVVFSPDGNLIVSGSDDKSIRMWDANTGKQVFVLADAHESGVRALAFVRDGSRFASGSYDKTICVRDTTTATPILPPFQGHQHWILCIAFSPDDTKIVSGACDASVRVWDASTGNNIFSILDAHIPLIEDVTFSPDGLTIISCSGDSKIRFWDARTGKETLAPLLGHSQGVRSVAISPDGKLVVSGSGDTTVGVWDISTRAIAKDHGHSAHVFSVAFSPDGSKMASGSADKTIRLWDVSSGDEMCSLRGHERAVFSVAFSPDGLKLVSGSGDCTVRVWDVNTGTLALPPLRGHDDWVFSVAWSPDSSRLISGSGDKTVRVWDAGTGMEILPPLRGHQMPVTAVNVSTDGSHIISGSWDRMVCVWDMKTGSMKHATPLAQEAAVSVAVSSDLPKQILGGFGKMIPDEETSVATEALLPVPSYQHCVFSVAYSPDGSKIAAASYDKLVRGWADSSGARAIPTLGGHTHWILSVSFAPDNFFLASGSWDTTIRVWNITNGNESLPVLRGHEGPVFSVAFSADESMLASGSGDKTIRLWSPVDGTDVLPPLRGHEDRVHSVAFSPDSSKIVSGSWDKTIRIWNSKTGAEAFPALRGHDGPVLSVAFSTDNSKIVSGSVDQTVRIWSVDTVVECLHTLRGHTDWIFSVAVSPDGTTIASGSGDGTIRTWNISEGSEILQPLRGHDMAVMSVAFSSDGVKLVSGSWDKTVRVWDTKTRAECMPIVQGYDDAVLLVEFTADESHLVSWSFDKTHRLWDMHPDQQNVSSSSDWNHGAPIPLLQKHGIAYPLSKAPTSTRRPRAGEFYVNKRNGWIEHLTTGQRAKVPVGIELSNYRAHGSTLVGWTDENMPVFIKFIAK